MQFFFLFSCFEIENCFVCLLLGVQDRSRCRWGRDGIDRVKDGTHMSGGVLQTTRGQRGHKKILSKIFSLQWQNFLPLVFFFIASIGQQQLCCRFQLVVIGIPCEDDGYGFGPNFTDDSVQSTSQLTLAAFRISSGRSLTEIVNQSKEFCACEYSIKPVLRNRNI